MAADSFKVVEAGKDGRVLELTAEYAIRTRRTGRIRAEWGALTPDQIRDVIDSTPSTRERYELVVRYVTAWEVAE